jgi:hypothetical protein
VRAGGAAAPVESAAVEDDVVETVENTLPVTR